MRDELIEYAKEAGLAKDEAAQLVRRMLDRLLAGNRALAAAGAAVCDEWQAVWSGMLRAVDQASQGSPDAFRLPGQGWSPGTP